MDQHDVEFWSPCQPSRASAIGVIVAMLMLVLSAAGLIVAAVI